ncbi:MAG: tryptophan 2,3-dioxygenase family protein [Myxococcota bacterium]|nr:tryptophan 2,3-dioxygenase family protein [Myxococcota bacterium]
MSTEHRSSQKPSPSTEHASSTHVDLQGEEVHWRQDMSYGGYLQLDQLLGAFKPVSDEHDEHLFITIHQASELWIRLCLHELRAAMTALAAKEVGPALKMLARIAQIQGNLKKSWQILSTMTPSDYLSFRDKLGQSSGFQSFQYRELEYRLGNKNPKMAEVHRGSPHYHPLQAALDTPSLYDLSLQLLAAEGFAIPAAKLSGPWREPYVPDSTVESAWLEVYRNPERYWSLYELAEKLVDLEQQFHAWRFAHMKTVERIIGFKRGTGGTGGVSYLVKALDLRFFPELWTLRTSL